MVDEVLARPRACPRWIVVMASATGPTLVEESRTAECSLWDTAGAAGSPACSWDRWGCVLDARNTVEKIRTLGSAPRFVNCRPHTRSAAVEHSEDR
jgi:hypothetical protein